MFMFELPIYLIEIRGYSATAAAAAILPIVAEIFVLSRVTGAWASRAGPRMLLTLGSMLVSAGFALLSLGDVVFPGIVTLGLGMAMIVAPLTTAVMTSLDTGHAGLASGVNNAVARVAGLVGVSVIGVVVASTLVGDNFAANDQSVRAFHQAVAICAGLVAAGGVVGALGIVNPVRAVEAERCPGGQLVGSPQQVVAAQSPGRLSGKRSSPSSGIGSQGAA
jgi:hypothetical protein